MVLAEMAQAVMAGGPDALFVVAVPALLMLVGEVAAAGMRIPERLQACTQNFSGGLLMSAVAGELFPLMSGKGTSMAGLCCGFMLGLLFMFGLEHLTENDDHDEQPQSSRCDTSQSAISVPPASAEEKAEREQNLAVFKKEAPSLLKGIDQLDNSIKEAYKDGSREGIVETLHLLMYQTDTLRRQLKNEPLDENNIKRMGDHIQELRENYATILSTNATSGAGKALDAFQKTLGHLHECSRKRWRRWRPEPNPDKDKQLKEKIPWPLVFAVCVDSAVDGLLIGLAFTATASAGWCMSIATSIEMGFLGLSFMATLRNSTRSCLKLGMLVGLPPLTLLLCGLAGQASGELLQDSSFLFTGFIAFSVVALLFLVTQELLAEAREVVGDSKRANCILFLGLLAGILLGRVVG